MRWKKVLLAVAGVGFLLSSYHFCSVVEAADGQAVVSSSEQEKKSEGHTIYEGKVTGPWTTDGTRALSLGKKTRYPDEGGTWSYGFWNVKVRS